MNYTPHSSTEERAVQITVGPVMLDGDVSIPHQARGIVVFAHGGGSSRQSPRKPRVAAPAGSRQDPPFFDANVYSLSLSKQARAIPDKTPAASRQEQRSQRFFVRKLSLILPR